jgi:kynurenine formamidase
VRRETVLAASRTTRTGEVFSLALPLDRTGPQPGRTARVNPQHLMIRSGLDMAPDASGMHSTDDVVYMPLQCSTQWDALCHVFYDRQTYHGRGPESVTSEGARFASITTMRDRAVGRGVLLDVARYFGREYLDPGTSVQDIDLEQCAASQGVAVSEGDFVLVRTGHLERRRRDWQDYVAGPAPGLGLSAADFLCPRGVTAVATDTWGLEVVPFETPAEVRHPLHIVLLVNAGIYIGEMWDLEELARACASDRIYEFLLVAQPLTVTGAVGSPVNPIAIR